jgi:SWI/SNF-related matrix-associated actin-dependent regulator of chromatin subfamily A3
MSLCNTGPFGCMHRRTSQTLKRLMAFPGVRIEGIVSWSDLEKAKTEWKHSGRSARLSLDVGVYGPGLSHVAKPVGRTLSDAKLFLQLPRSSTESLPYSNPQYLKVPNVSHIQILDTPEVALTEPLQKNKYVSRVELELILDHIPQPKFLREASTSEQIRTPLMRYAFDQVNWRTLTEEDTKKRPSISCAEERLETCLLL